MTSKSLGILLLIAGLSAQTPPAPKAFQAGDRWIAIGDSITHSRRYHSFIYLFHATRYPNEAFRLINAGISGDSASGAVSRFDWDIGLHQPTVATIMLGMNDVNRSLYGLKPADEANLAKRKEALDGHFDAMEKLVAKLKALNTRLYFITPSIYDQTGTQATENLFGVNDALHTCGEGAKALAARVGGRVLDLHDPMTELNARVQKADPKATIVGADRVHPGDPGQFAMAYYLLKGLGVSGNVSEISLDGKTGSALRSVNAKLAGLSAQNGALSFDALEGALPYPMLPAAEDILKWIPFQDEFNRETLTVSGLPDAPHTLTIDGQYVTNATGSQWAKGISLSGNALSPMLKHAKAVMDIEEKRYALAARMRTFAAIRHSAARSAPDVNPEDFEAMKAFLMADLEKKKSMGNFGYFKSVADTYITYKPKEAEMKKEMEALIAAIWASNKPATHHFEIKAGAAPAASPSVKPPSLPGTLDDFDDAGKWQKTSWTPAAPAMTVADGILTLTAPRAPGVRDMLGIMRDISADITGKKFLKIRVMGDVGAPFGVETTLDGKLVRLSSYEKLKGNWQEISLPLSAASLKGITLLLAEGGKDDVWPAATVSYSFDRIWLE